MLHQKQTPHPSEPFAPLHTGGNAPGSVWQIHCPNCGSGCLESTGDVVAHPDDDEYAPTNPLGSRGEFVSTRFTCAECGVVLALSSGNHKGSQWVGLHIVGIAARGPSGYEQNVAYIRPRHTRAGLGGGCLTDHAFTFAEQVWNDDRSASC